MESGTDSAVCLGTAAPTAPFCPAANPFDSAATVGDHGDCVHACQAPDAWSESHVCYPLVSAGTFDNSNNTCGIGNCDRHTTEVACTAGDGHWQLATPLSGGSCSNVQFAANYFTVDVAADNGPVGVVISHMLVEFGEDCCPGFNLAGYAVCSYADQDAVTALDTAASREAEFAAIDALDSGCHACLMDTDGDFAACIAANPNPGTSTGGGGGGECHASCTSDPTTCDEFTAFIAPGGCAETCPVELGPEWLEAATGEFCGTAGPDGTGNASCTIRVSLAPP